MADSTPSQTQSNVSSEAFEALIDLLATDGIDEQPSTLPGARTRAEANVTLRDNSGRLDFEKIRLMFSGQPDNPLLSDIAGSLADGTRRSMRRSEEGDSDDESPPSHRSSPTLPSPPISPPPPPPMNQRTTGGHRRSSTFGNQPCVGVADSGRNADEDVPRTMPDQPLSFDELNNALTNAHAEVKSLRQQYDELHALISKCSGNQTKEKQQIGSSGVDIETNKQVESDLPPEKKEGELIQQQLGKEGFRVQPDEACSLSSLPSDVPLEVANLTENEAKRTLAALARLLNLSPATIGPLATAPPSTSSPSPPQMRGQHDINSLTRAVKFVSTVDELVWRRSVGSHALQPVFSEENVAALLSRLELWERAVRRSSRI